MAAGSTLVAHVVVELERALLDGAVGEDHDQQGQAGPEADQLDRADRGGRLVRRAHHDRGVGGEVGEQARGPLEQLLDLAVDLVEETADLLALGRARGRPGSARWSTKKR